MTLTSFLYNSDRGGYLPSGVDLKVEAELLKLQVPEDTENPKEIEDANS